MCIGHKIGGREAVIVGAGPNGLTAAWVLAKAGARVTVLEQEHTPGGSARSADLIEPGVIHDVCATSLPLGVSSPVISAMELEEVGVKWLHAPFAMAHPMDDGPAPVLSRSIEETAESFGNAHDAERYLRLMSPLAENWGIIVEQILSPLHVPGRPLLLGRFALAAIRSAKGLAGRFRGEQARAFMAGLAAHSGLPLDRTAGAAFGIVLGAAGHAAGWPFVEGGTQRLIEAMCARVKECGGTILTGRKVSRMGDLPPADAYLFDVTPRQLLAIAGEQLPGLYRRRLQHYRYGPGVFKMDWTLNSPVPWKAEEARRAGVIHLGGTFEEIELSERCVDNGRVSKAPFLLLAQSGVADTTRAKSGQHTLWGYCHTPNGSVEDLSERIEARIEEFAPGFLKVVRGRHFMNCRELEERNPNLVGGDIGAGSNVISQIFTRPVTSLVPWGTPNPHIFICSASTPPGGGVHGMCGYNAARAVLRRWTG